MKKHRNYLVVRRTAFIQIIISAILLYGVAVSTMIIPRFNMSLYNSLLFHPTRTKTYNIHKVGDVPIEDVKFQSSNGTNLHGWMLRAPNEKGLVLFNHGNGGNLSHRILLYPLYLKQGLSVFTYDYQGYGQSDGAPSLDNICNDGLAAYDYVTKELKYSSDRIIVVGESLGGGVATHVCGQKPARAVVLQSTFSSLPSVAKRHFQFFRLFPPSLLPDQQLDNAAFVAGDHPPLLIMHGDSDYVVPYSECLLLTKAASKPTHIVRFAGAGHNNLFTTYADKYSETITDFLKSQDLLSVDSSKSKFVGSLKNAVETPDSIPAAWN